jgi:F0F1-type ATP synthase beta subunit
MSIHRHQDSKIYQLHQVLFTGIKVIDLIEPYSKGKIGLFGGPVLVKQY